MPSPASDTLLPEVIDAHDPMSVEEAEALIGVAVASGTQYCDAINALHDGRAWLSLGYDSWQALANDRLRGLPQLHRDERREVVAHLYSTGMSQRDIAVAIGVDPMTVNRDLAEAGVEIATPEASPVTMGNDGKTYKRKPHLPSGKPRKFRPDKFVARLAGQLEAMSLVLPEMDLQGHAATEEQLKQLRSGRDEINRLIKRVTPKRSANDGATA
jgi:transposase-like protein